MSAALAQLPNYLQVAKTARDDREPEREICLTADSAGAAHGFVDELVARKIAYSIGFSADERVRLAICEVSEFDWVPAVEANGEVRDGAEVVELTGVASLSGWPEGCRLIVRRERPHPGAQLSLFDEDCDYRHQAHITDGPGAPADVELFHRQHARGEDRITVVKDSGLENFPFECFARKQACPALVTIAADLIAWAKMACSDAAFVSAEPKRIRYALLHVAARIIHRSRQLIVAIDRTWPWAKELARAFTRLRQDLPA